MAHSLSAKKRARQNERRRMRNRSAKRSVKTQIRQFEVAVREKKEAEVVEQALRSVQKKIDKLAAKGTMHKNTAARRKSRLARQLNAMKAKAG